MALSQGRIDAIIVMIEAVLSNCLFSSLLLSLLFFSLKFILLFVNFTCHCVFCACWCFSKNDSNEEVSLFNSLSEASVISNNTDTAWQSSTILSIHEVEVPAKESEGQQGGDDLDDSSSALRSDSMDRVSPLIIQQSTEKLNFNDSSDYVFSVSNL